ncbi:MAG: agmatinase [Chloroflexota bacterium]|nr:agmatinase [Chloroflexota bacterium]
MDIKPGGLLREGWPSFFGAPRTLDLEELEAQVAFLGVPFDVATNDRPGSRFAPQAIREASMRYNDLRQGWLDLERGVSILQGVTLADCGDVDIRVKPLEDIYDQITEAVGQILARRAFPVLVGGDHAITFPAVRAFQGHPLWVVSFDAHLDFTDEYLGVRLSHDNEMRRIAELPFVQGVSFIGPRGMVNRRAPYDEALKYGARVITAEELAEKGILALRDLPPMERIYLSMDIDVLDPAVCPGTGYPEPGGLSYYQMRKAIEFVAGLGQIVGLDLMEVNPIYDPSGRTARTAAYLILHALGLALRARERAKERLGKRQTR